MPELKASPRNRALGLLADALSGAKSAADTVQLPVVGGLGSLLFGDAPELVNDVAYYGPQALVRGGNAATGGLGTFAPDRRVLDAIGVAPMAPGAVRAAKTIANPMTYGRAFMEAQAPAVMSPITAWHGSPHKFRKFDNSKMGTGEGAQAYGAGAYLADAREVAEGYQSALTGFNPMHIESDLVSKGISPETANTYAQFAAQTGGKKTSFENFKKSIQEKGPSPFIESYRQKIRSEFPKLEKAIEGQSGYLYKADIPDEAVANMLLWDKPLSEQPESVKRALGSMFSINRDKVLAKDVGGNDPTGSLIYNRLQDLMSGGNKNDAFSNSANYGQRIASQELLDLGIPGIRYLDAGSRGQGAGTMNTVVFDDSIIKILERNGVPLGLLAD